jgi:hypothetical protein
VLAVAKLPTKELISEMKPKSLEYLNPCSSVPSHINKGITVRGTSHLEKRGIGCEARILKRPVFGPLAPHEVPAGEDASEGRHLLTADCR